MLYNLFENRDFVSVFAVALLAEGVDRNVERGLLEIYRFVSPSSRRAWIEIAASSPPGASAAASPSSRRAWIEILVAREVKRAALVALLAEGVDRNNYLYKYGKEGGVALLAEGVDRNSSSYVNVINHALSPSSRRAWIEIGLRNQRRTRRNVALLAEGVDRNR